MTKNTHDKIALFKFSAASVAGHYIAYLNTQETVIFKNVSVKVFSTNTGQQVESKSSKRAREEFHFVKGDIRDFNLVKEIMKDKDAVFHEAALVSVTLSVENPILLSSPISKNLNAFVIRT